MLTRSINDLNDEEILILEVLIHKYLYFEMDRPLIPDTNYDDLKFFLDTSPGYGFPHGHKLATTAAVEAKTRLGIS